MRKWAGTGWSAANRDASSRASSTIRPTYSNPTFQNSVVTFSSDGRRWVYAVGIRAGRWLCRQGDFMVKASLPTVISTSQR
jgi:hypothetical protein